MDKWTLVMVEEQRAQLTREIEIDGAAFDRLIDNLKSGTYTIIATDDRVTISGTYVDYVLLRKAGS